MTDLADLIPASETITVTLLHPNTAEVLKNEDGSDMTIDIYATWSRQYKKAQYDEINARLEAMKGDESLQDYDAEEATIAVLSRLTKSWNITYKGSTPDVDMAKEVYSAVTWIKNQVEGELNQDMVFTEVSSESS